MAPMHRLRCGRQVPSASRERLTAKASGYAGLTCIAHPPIGSAGWPVADPLERVRFDAAAAAVLAWVSVCGRWDRHRAAGLHPDTVN